MAPRDPSQVQLDFPELIADLIRQLRLTGTVGVLELLDQVRPVYIVAQREGALAITVTPPIFSSADITSGSANASAANAIIMDSGPLPAGDYDVFGSLSIRGTSTVNGPCALQHRDAANAVTLATLLQVSFDGGALLNDLDLPPIVYTLGLNERLRVQNLSGAVVGIISGVIAHRIRPTP